MKRNLVLIVDGENILHQSFHKFEKLKSTDGKPSGAIFGFFKSLHMYLNRFDPKEVYITFDNGKSPYRLELIPEYKGHRKDLSFDRESLYNQKQVILKILCMLRISYLFDKNKSTNYEGDDFLYALAMQKLEEGKSLLIVSSDKDFNQLLTNKKIKIYNPRKECYVTYKNCKDLFGYEPEETVRYLSLVGDTSDDIPGVKGIGPVKARKILDGDFDEWLVDQSEETQKVLERNKKIIDLHYFISTYPLKSLPIKTYKVKEIKANRFKEICIDYSFNSFLTIEFMKVFKNLIR